LLCVAFAGLGALAAIALSLSALPLAAKAPLAVLACWRGGSLARREWLRPRCTLEFDAEGGSAVIVRGGHSEAMLSPRLALRGPIAALAWRGEGGRRERLAWAADTLPPPARRRLLLRFASGAAA
jgi:hypothetical protein